MPRRLLGRLVPYREPELAAMLWSAAYFFCLLGAYYVLRPVREAMGVAGDVRKLPWLFTGTLLATFLVNPLFGALVTWMPRRRFLPLVYHACAATLLVFAALLRSVPSDRVVAVGYAFYVWTAVFSLFAVSVFWGFMADLWSHDQGKRLFAFIGAGGTLGAMAGSFLTARLAERLGPVPLLLAAAAVLELAVLCVHRLTAALRPADSGGVARRADASEGGPLAGMRLVARSRYLQMICLYLLLFTTTSTILYFQQAQIVKRSAETAGGWTAIFADIDFYTNLVALVLEGLLTARILRWIGVGATLTVLPVWTAAGFAALLRWPTLPVLVVVQVLRRGLDYGLTKPAREVLYTVVGRETKYKAKSFIDTFVYRGGDAFAAWALTGAALVWTALPLSALWLFVALALGRRDAALVRAQEEGATAESA